MADFKKCKSLGHPGEIIHNSRKKSSQCRWLKKEAEESTNAVYQDCARVLLQTGREAEDIMAGETVRSMGICCYIASI